MTPVSSAPSIEHVHKKEHVDIDQYLKIAEIVSAVAIISFAFYVDATLFTASFVVGVGIGMYQKIKVMDSCKHGGASCSQGLFEQLFQIKLPRVVELIGTVAGLLCHIDHHPTVFVPISGIYCGAKFGKWITQNRS